MVGGGFAVMIGEDWRQNPSHQIVALQPPKTDGAAGRASEQTELTDGLQV